MRQCESSDASMLRNHQVPIARFAWISVSSCTMVIAIQVYEPSRPGSDLSQRASVPSRSGIISWARQAGPPLSPDASHQAQQLVLFEGGPQKDAGREHQW